MTIAAFLVDLAGLWLSLGAVVAVVFLGVGVDQIDEDAQGAYAFRPLLIPGVLLIWPLVLWRWIRLVTGGDDLLARYRPPRAVHLPVASLLAATLAFAVVAGLAVRQSWPVHITPERISEAEQ